MKNAFFLLSSLVLGLAGGCAQGAHSEQVAGKAPALVAVSADSLEGLAERENFMVDLRRTDVVYEIDGASEQLDIDRLTIITPEAENVSLRDYAQALGGHFNEQDFTLRLSGDPSLLATSSGSNIGVTTQAMMRAPGRSAGGTTGYNCPPSIPPFCSCTGDIDCNKMLGPDGPCGGGGTECGTEGCVCFPY
jgi:hypothetical protein